MSDVEEPAPANNPARRTVPAAALVLAVVVAALLGILAVVALAGADATGSSEEVDEARFAAGQFTERFLTFEHDALDDWKADVLALSTGAFAGEVEEVEEGLRRLIAESEIDARTEASTIFLSEIDRGSVSAIVVYDRDVIDPSGTRSERDRYMQLELDLVEGTWLVDNVIDIATAAPAGAGDEPGPTTSSTVPAGTEPGG